MKYIEKPVVIEAFQWSGWGIEEGVDLAKRLGIRAITGPEAQLLRKNDPNFEMHGAHYIINNYGWVRTLEGYMLVRTGDWIIIGAKGEMYPCKPDIFEAAYEKVEESN